MNNERLGIGLIILAFLAGAFLAVLHPREIDWLYFLPTLAAGAVGVVILRRARHAAASSSHVMDENRQVLEQCLERITSELDQMDGDRDAIPPYELRFEIDRRFRDDLMRFADARMTLAHLYGLQQYADIMSHFAAGERYLNRVWSASADGYAEEALTYVGKARKQFWDARDLLASVAAGSPQSTGSAAGSA